VSLRERPAEEPLRAGGEPHLVPTSAPPLPSEPRLVPRDERAPLLFATVFLPVGLFLAYRFNPILAHSLAEIFSVVVACGIFMMTWNARRFIDNDYYLVLGIAYLFVGALDYVHATSFDGIFTVEHRGSAIELWFAARFLQSGALLAAPLFVTRRARPALVLAIFAVLTASLAGIVFSGLLPQLYTPSAGLLPAKVYGDHLVSAAFLLAAAALYSVRDRFDPAVFRELLLSILFSVLAEISADVYTDSFVYNSVVGHYFKVISFYLVYRAVIATGLVRPYEVMFRNLKQSEAELRVARDGLETRVAERTRELHAANLKLEEELAARRRAIESRELVLELLQRTSSSSTVREFVEALVPFLQERLDFEAVGVRLRSGTDYPYLETHGFAEVFVNTASGLLSNDSCAAGATDLDCACEAVLDGRCSPEMPFVSPGGTLWLNTGADAPEARTKLKLISNRGKCFRGGYRSLALAPLKAGGASLGILQLCDRRPDRIDPHLLARIEQVAETVAGRLARLQIQEAHRESENRFRTLLENSSVVSVICQESQIRYGNPAMELTFGSPREGASLRDLGEIHPEDRKAFEQFCEEIDLLLARPDDLVLRFLVLDQESREKQLRWFKCQSIPIGFRGQPAVLVELVDVTRLKELEQTVAARERLASLGQMAAGIAHEIRNPLSGINLNVSTLGLLTERAEGLTPAEQERFQAVLAQIKSASQKTSLVIRRVMEFSKPSPPKMDRIDLAGPVREAIALSLPSLRKDGIELVEELGSAPTYCTADPALLEQVVLNLLTNAIQAMKDPLAAGARPATLTVSVGQEGEHAVVRVADSGPGVPPHLRDRIFEPFFTTKKEGHGIGLSFSHRIVADHGGRLRVGASASGGAEFRVELPLGVERRGP
jgi:PAS domain S-box-containing protein